METSLLAAFTSRLTIKADEKKIELIWCFKKNFMNNLYYLNENNWVQEEFVLKLKIQDKTLDEFFSSVGAAHYQNNNDYYHNNYHEN